MMSLGIRTLVLCTVVASGLAFSANFASAAKTTRDLLSSGTCTDTSKFEYTSYKHSWAGVYVSASVCNSKKSTASTQKPINRTCTPPAVEFNIPGSNAYICVSCPTGYKPSDDSTTCISSP